MITFCLLSSYESIWVISAPHCVSYTLLTELVWAIAVIPLSLISSVSASLFKEHLASTGCLLLSLDNA